jgi:hypothetical protein
MFRPTPRRPRKSHSLCVLPRSPGRENSQVRSDSWTFSPSDVLKAVSDQSFSFQSITGSPTQRQSTISFSFNDLRTLVTATEGILPGLPFWNSPSFLSPKHYPISLQALTGTHFTTPFLSYSSRNGGGTPPTSFRRWDVQNCGRSDESVRPIAAHALWCHNPQRHKISLRSGETTPLSPVSKSMRADNGTSSWSPLQVVPGSSVLGFQGLYLQTLSQ